MEPFFADGNSKCASSFTDPDLYKNEIAKRKAEAGSDGEKKLYT
jgi:hypothetical protein